MRRSEPILAASQWTAPIRSWGAAPVVPCVNTPQILWLEAVGPFFSLLLGILSLLHIPVHSGLWGCVSSALPLCAKVPLCLTQNNVDLRTAPNQ